MPSTAAQIGGAGVADRLEAEPKCSSNAMLAPRAPMPSMASSGLVGDGLSGARPMAAPMAKRCALVAQALEVEEHRVVRQHEGWPPGRWKVSRPASRSAPGDAGDDDAFDARRPPLRERRRQLPRPAVDQDEIGPLGRFVGGAFVRHLRRRPVSFGGRVGEAGSAEVSTSRIMAKSSLPAALFDVELRYGFFPGRAVRRRSCRRPAEPLDVRVVIDLDALRRGNEAEHFGDAQQQLVSAALSAAHQRLAGVQHGGGGDLALLAALGQRTSTLRSWRASAPRRAARPGTSSDRRIRRGRLRPS